MKQQDNHSPSKIIPSLMTQTPLIIGRAIKNEFQKKE
jgi:hypothetical protein